MKMKSNEVVLSDVHIYTENIETSDEISRYLPEQWKRKLKVVQSRFVINPPEMLTEKNKNNPAKMNASALVTDEDGDLIIARQKSVYKKVIVLEHFMATPLNLVGLQVWRGATFLADFIVHHGSKLFKDGHVLELGGGTGLCSIIASMYAKHVLCTDTGNIQLELCKKNIDKNKILRRDYEICQTTVKELDWTSDDPLQAEGNFGWNEADKQILSKVNILIAADVIYDDKITDAFFKTIEWLATLRPSKTLYLALEKRINFSLKELDVVSPAYDYFRQCLCDLRTKYRIEKINVDFPQYFQYDRIAQLELWRISLNLQSFVK